MRNNRIAGYSLLEIIVVLGLIGVIMIPLSRFIINKIENNHRQQISDAIVDEMYRFIDFINNDELELPDGSLKYNPLFQIDNKIPEYGYRVDNYKIEDELTYNEMYFNWPEGNNSHRKFFIDESCQGSSLGLFLKKEFLKCKLDPIISENPMLSIERVDLVGDQKKKTIERVDFIVLYHPESEEDRLYLDSFYSNFMQSFKDKYLYLNQADIVTKEKSNKNNHWKLAKNNNKNIDFGNLVSNIDAFNNNLDYGIRFSFNIKAGKYLKSDGSVHADKLCWNTKTTQYGPCLSTKNDDKNKLVLTSGDVDKDNKKPALCWDLQNNKEGVCLELRKQQNINIDANFQYLDDSNFMLTKNDDKGNEKSATIVANVVIEDSHYEGGKLVKEYRTVPEVSYHNFTGNEKGMIVNGEYQGDDEKEKGTIVIPRKLCPVVGNVRLWPRITLAVSSMMPVIFDENKGGLDIDLSKEYHTRGKAIKNTGISSGVVLQPRIGTAPGTANTPMKLTWVISASLGVNDPSKADSSTYVNPKSLSIMAVEWCSSIKGDYGVAP